jgi:tRNA modification GTPase
MLSHDDECIVAQCTPQGIGALALLRISGSSIRSIVNNIARLASKKSITEVATHTIHYGSIVDDQGNLIDQVMFIVMDGPRTFTSQDTIEITCHNNPFIIESIINQIIRQGGRLAQEGEFTRRAFQAGKIDLTQAEAIHELIGAQTQQALKASLAQLEGSLSNWVKVLEKELLQAIAWCEASFEFLDEEVEFGNRIEQRLDKILNTIKTLKHIFNMQQQVRQGIRIALIGSVNTGKSSLFNMLLHQKRAIVSDIAGTTRDSIEAGLTIKGNQWTLVDTAGLRSTNDLIEQEGIKRSHEEAKKADIILLVMDGSRSLTDQEYVVYKGIQETYSTKCMLINNKADCPPAVNEKFLEQSVLRVSTIIGNDRERLENAIQEKIDELLDDLDSPFLLNARQNRLIIALESKLAHIRLHMLTSPQYELISYHLQDALTTLSELTGKSIGEAALDTVFKEFCVGK